MNAPISIITPGNPWVGTGTEILQSISSLKRLVIVYPGDNPVVNTITCTPAQVVNIDGTLTSPPLYEISRVANTWLLVTQKNVLSLHSADVGSGLNNVLLVPEYLFPNYDGLLGGDQNYGILARVLHHEIRVYQNV